MQSVLVLGTNRQPLMPTHPAKARKLLKAGKAAVYRRYPFTIILKYAPKQVQTQPIELKIDPGSKTSGLALVTAGKLGWCVRWAGNLHHRGQTVKLKLAKRRAVRRSRRGRKTRYRQARFLNRTRPAGWLPPSLQSRVDNVYHRAGKLMGVAPVTAIQIETVRFDTQLMQNAEVSGIMYQQGTLQGYEVREYLLEKWGRKCAYCGATDVPLEIEHINPRSRGGSDRASNLTLACTPCNRAKGSQTAAEYGYSAIQAQAKQSLRDAAAVNSTRYAIGDVLKSYGLPVSFWSGGRTKHNRIGQRYAKDHWIDAACVGETGAAVYIPETLTPLQIKAVGRGSRQQCLMDKYGFPRTRAKKGKRVKGFQTGDMVRAIVPTGKRAGTHIGRVAVRATGSFRVGKTDGINWKYCSLVQRTDGYEYAV